MAVAAFNTLNFTRRLRAAGIPPEQAEAFADALSEDAFGEVATKRDLADLEARVDRRFDVVDARFDALDAAINARFEAVDLRFTAIENRIVIKLGAMMAALAALVFAGLRLGH